MPRLNASELDKIYKEADNVDKEIFSEMRSNVLLVSGDHYQRKGSRFWERIRDKESLSQNQKLRLTKNHLKKIANDITSVILSHAPATHIQPNNKDEVQDQKTAELNNSVHAYLKKTLNLRAKTIDKGEDLTVFGECCSRIFFDPDLGKLKGHEPLIDEDGNATIDQESGKIVGDENLPIMQGMFSVERVLPFNLLRAPEAQTMEESSYLIIRKMMDKSILEGFIPLGDKERVFGGSDETYMVFNGDNGTFERTKKQILVREHYYRPSKLYPNGYYYIATASYIISEGELPYGVWPITHAIYDKVPTSPRGRSPIKQMRPYQIEINRAASAIATAQITLGDDKVIMNHGARMAHGGQVPGVRGISLTGAGSDIKILPGRGGEQYVPYMQSQISEMYQIMNVNESDVTNSEGKLDPYALLFNSMRNKKKFKKYTEAFEKFNVDETEILLDLSRFYLDEDIMVPMIGRSGMVNIKEFRHSEPNSYRISIESIDGDAETMLGKQLAMNHTLQYVGSSLDKEDLGRIIRTMPFVNEEEAFSELTIDYDNAKNDILALERGETFPVNKFDNHLFIIKRLANRMKKPDFKFLDPKIQENFIKKLTEHEQIDALQKQEILRAQQGFIPTGGYLVTADFYVSKGDGKTKRVRLPYESINWLIEQLQAQGQSLEQLENMNQGALSEIARQITSKGQARPSEQTNSGQARPQLQGALPNGTY